MIVKDFYELNASLRNNLKLIQLGLYLELDFNGFNVNVKFLVLTTLLSYIN